ncbi:MAG: hypothetical protein ACOX2O_09735 [Bdellovibrionota bacterium]|jgi:hypothetical protein
MQRDVLDDAVRYLEAVEDCYPTGVLLQQAPLVAEKKIRGSRQNSSYIGGDKVEVLFVTLSVGDADFSATPEGALLFAAIEKGLKKTLNEVGILPLFKEVSLKQKSNGEAVLEIATRHEVHLIILLGEEVWNVLDNSKKVRGELSTIQNLVVMPTVSLQSSLTDKNMKRAFWNDLKTVMAKLNWN